MIWITSGPGMFPVATRVGHNARFTAIRQGDRAALLPLRRRGMSPGMLRRQFGCLACHDRDGSPRRVVNARPRCQ